MYNDQEYWDVMPEWMRIAYRKEVLIFQVVQSAMAADLPPSELVSKCGEVLLRRYTELKEETIQKAMLQTSIFISK